MVRYDFRLTRRDSGKSLLERARDPAVQLLPTTLEQALIGRIAHKCVLEAVGGFRRFAASRYEFGLLEFAQRCFQCGLVASDHARTKE